MSGFLSTWLNLDRVFAACSVAFGLACTFKPEMTGGFFTVALRSASEDEKRQGAAAAMTRNDNWEAVAMLIGSRDLAIGIAILALSRAGKHDEMGIVMLSTLCASISDTQLAWRNRKYPEATFIAATGAGVALVGAKLCRLV
ncbi:hypothetical protein LEL_05626 [Akanthomyces lecanii RCEF 1005]|uniref:DUF4267 domain-containing protein n=1 Tax=Akanthomyces lecanii RCEF 1005 TaxID=1081108 RepID=A0A162JZX1_CORDF|nr:hypothetical protein LEL_05626 [Akanthomyces lecanii RCEF 1005]